MLVLIDSLHPALYVLLTLHDHMLEIVMLPSSNSLMSFLVAYLCILNISV